MRKGNFSNAQIKENVIIFDLYIFQSVALVKNRQQ